MNSNSVESQFNIKQHNPNSEKTYEFERFFLDAAKLMLYKDGTAVDLAPKVVETLLALVERSGVIVSKDELMVRLWADSYVDEGNLTQYIYLLRKSLGDTLDGRPMIETFRRRGYRFNGELSESSSGKVVNVHRAIGRWYLIATVIGIIAVITLGPWYLTRKGNSEAMVSIATELTFRRLVPGVNVFSPAISPDTKYFAYCLTEPAGHSLWIRELNTEQATRLTPSLFKSCNAPVFSPDNKQLYFVNQDNILSRIPVSGGVPVQVVRNEPNPFAISPDGRQAVFVRGRFVVVASTDGSGESNVSERDGESKWYSSLAALPSWSPDGKRIVLSGGRIEKGRKIAELIEITMETGAERLIQIPNWYTINSTAWSRDGSYLFVTARERIAMPLQIWRLSQADGSATRVTNDLQSYDRITLSDDGQILLAEKTVGACNIWVGSTTDPGSFKQVTFDDGDVTGRSGLALKPDGTVIFSAAFSGNLDIWQINPDGSGLKQLTVNAGDRNIRQQATNDGKHIVFVSRASGTTRRSIWRMDADGSNLIELTNGGQDYPGVSPDGKWVYFTDIAERVSSIWKVSIDGGETSRVTGDYPAYIPSISPDGTMLAFVYGGDNDIAESGNLAVLNLNGTEPPKIFDIHPVRGLSQWSRDGKSLLFIRKGTPNLWSQPIDGSPPTQVTSLDLETTWNFAVSPNSDVIAVARGNAATEPILISNLQR